MSPRPILKVNIPDNDHADRAHRGRAKDEGSVSPLSSASPISHDRHSLAFALQSPTVQAYLERKNGLNSPSAQAYLKKKLSKKGKQRVGDYTPEELAQFQNALAGPSGMSHKTAGGLQHIPHRPSNGRGRSQGRGERSPYPGSHVSDAGIPPRSTSRRHDGFEQIPLGRPVQHPATARQPGRQRGGERAYFQGQRPVHAQRHPNRGRQQDRISPGQLETGEKSVKREWSQIWHLAILFGLLVGGLVLGISIWALRPK